VFAIAIQVNLMLVLVGLSYGMLSDFQRRSSGVGADIIIRPPGTAVLGMSAAPMKAAWVTYFESRPEVAMALGITVHNLEGFLNSVTGIDIQRFNSFSGGFRFLSGGPWKNPDDLVVDEYYAQQNKLKAGDTLKILNRPMYVSGIVESGKMSRVFMDIHRLQDLTSNPDKLSQIYIKLKDPSRTIAVVQSLMNTPELKDYKIYSMQEFTSLISIDKAPGVKPFLGVIVGLSVVIGFLVVFLSLYTAVLERTREIGILKSLGASPLFIVNLLFRETIALSVVGGIVGIGLSYVSHWIIMTLIPASIQMQIVYEWWPISTSIAIGASLIGALYPGWKAAKQDAIEALAYE